MNKEEFLSILEKELESLPEDKREKYMVYYKACFDGIDEVSEKAIIFKLGNPKIIANNIIKEHQKSLKRANLSDGKRKFFDFFDKIKTGSIIKDYKFNFKNIVIAIILILAFILIILPLLGNASAIIFAILSIVFGVIFIIFLMPIIIFFFFFGLIFVSIFRIWDIKSASLSLILGVICIISSFFLGKFMYKGIKKAYSKLKSKV